MSKPAENKPTITQSDFGIEDSAGYKNLIAVRDYTKQTRELINDLRTEVQNLSNQIQQEKLEREQLKAQIVTLQMRLV